MTPDFALDTLLVSCILSLVQDQSLASVSESWYLWSLVYSLAGAMAMGLAMSPSEGMQSGLILLRIVDLIGFSGASAPKRLRLILPTNP